MTSAYAGEGNSNIFVHPGIHFLPGYSSSCDSYESDSYVGAGGFSWNRSFSVRDGWDAFGSAESVPSSFSTSGRFTSSESLNLFASTGINLVCTEDEHRLSATNSDKDNNTYVNVISHSGLFVRHKTEFSEDGEGTQITPNGINMHYNYRKSTMTPFSWKGSLWGPSGDSSFTFNPYNLQLTIYASHEYNQGRNEFSLPTLNSWGNKETIALVSDIEKLKESIPSKKYIHRLSSKYSTSNSGFVGFDLISTESTDLSSSSSKLLTIFKENSSNETLPCYGYISGLGQLNYIKNESSTLKVYYLNSSTSELETVDLNMESLTDKIIEI